MSGITQIQIADAMNISRSTVGAVLSNAPGARISKELREQIIETARRMGYRPNRYAQIMRKRNSGVIGIINFGGLQQMPIQKLMHAVRAITEAGFEPVVHDVFWFVDRGRLACEKMLEARVEGVILMHPPLLFTEKHLEVLLKAGVPVVAIGGDHLKSVSRVVSDKEKGFYEISSHLLGLGYRHLVLLLGKDSSDKKRTLSGHAKGAAAGFQRALKEYGGSDIDGTIHTIAHTLCRPGESSDLNPYTIGREGMGEILRRGTLPHAVLCSNDSWALGALAACAEADIQVPKEMAITGFENEPVGEVGLLPLTTMAHPVRAIAYEAVEILLGLIRKSSQSQPELRVLPGQLIVRRSCGAHLRQSHRQPAEQKALAHSAESSHP